MQDLNKESKRIARYRARMDAVDKWMGKHHLPKSLRTRIGHHYQEVNLCHPSKRLVSARPVRVSRFAFSAVGESHAWRASVQKVSRPLPPTFMSCHCTQKRNLLICLPGCTNDQAARNGFTEDALLRG